MTRTMAVLCLLVYLTTIGIVTGEEMHNPSSKERVQNLLDEAAGYASVYNYEKVEDLCERIISINSEKDIQARAHWLLAVAYGKFQVEYRTNRLGEKFQEQMHRIKELKHGLQHEILPRLEISLVFLLNEQDKLDGLLKQAEQA